MTDERFDQLLQDVRDETAPREQIDEAKDRVWRTIAGPATALCAEFRPQLDDYLAGRLAEKRRLLVEDHLARCAECRRLFAEAKGERKVVAIPNTRPRTRPAWMKWAIAAGVALGALYIGRDQIDTALAPGGPRATVVSVKGALYRLANGELRPGAELSEGEIVRTAAGGRAVLRLMDGSLVEVNERTELSVRAAWSGQSVVLERGDVIVQAAKQRRGHLRVATRDSIASVKGTIFAVSTGSGGTLVSVVEGKVAVSQPGKEKLLERGAQSSSNESLGAVPVREAVSWSADADKYYTLLADFMTIEKKLAELPGPAPRTQPRLLKYLPSSALVYAAVPNVSGTLRDTVSLIEQRARESAVLKEWWTSERGLELKKLIDNVQVVTPLLGEEMVFMAAKPLDTQVTIFLAEVQPGRKAALQQALDQVVAQTGDGLTYKLTDELLVISETTAELNTALSLMGSGANSAFATEIARRYQSGVGWLVGVDVQELQRVEQPGDGAILLGVRNMRHLFFEVRSLHGPADNQVTLSFQGARTGIASWLATPGASGSAEYISSEAVFALSASTRNPRQAFDELLASIGEVGGNLAVELREFETETGINVANDVAAALGTDFTLIVERPALPLPLWVGVAEVLQPGVLDSTIRRLVDAANRKGSHHVLSQETVNGRMWNTLKSDSGTQTLYWTYDRGYLVASTDRATAARAIAVRENGSPVIRSAGFRQQLPGSAGLYNSAFLWVNTQGALSELSGLITNPALKALLENRDPALVVLNGETERIHASSRTRLTSLILDFMVAGGAAHSTQPATQGVVMKELKRM
jgi:hypothetical protein